MGKKVKNTILRQLSDVIAPHYCCSCGAIGAILCEYCKYDIISEPFSSCIACLGVARPGVQQCHGCILPYRAAWCVGERSAALKAMIDGYKFSRMRGCAEVLSGLLDETIPHLSDITVVAVPTIAPHRRERGYGHAELLARKFARRRGLPYAQPLYRLTNVTQHGATRAQRQKQAASTFASRPIDGGRYLLIDDVYTTGSTLSHATTCLLEAGADEVWVAVVSRQPFQR